MASKKQVAVVEQPTPVVLFPIPEEKAPDKRTTKRGLEKLVHKLFMEHSEPMLQETFKAMRQKVRNGDSKIIEIVLQLHGLIASNKGTSVTANIIQSNSNRAEAVASNCIGKGFDSLVRKLDSRPDDAASEQTIDV